MKTTRLPLLLTFLLALASRLPASNGAPSLLAAEPAKGDFALATTKAAAPFLLEKETPAAVARAAEDLRHDIEAVTGHFPALAANADALPARTAVIVGVIGSSPIVDKLASGQPELQALAGAWESYVIEVVARPAPGVDQALVIAGSDRRGAIYGLYELSEAIGVSPWRWWADVPPQRHATLSISPGLRRFGPPSVRYRGIFLNDEDWGLRPWAASTFDAVTGNIGPKTYAKVFELLLRLKANTLWPAMHPGTTPFNAYPEDKQLADRYGIVMGSSHAEPMLRDNVGEWTAPPKDYNYVANRDGVLRYWEQRVAENGRFENIYTVGMRGVHDSAMQGPKTDPERIAVLERVFADQRALLRRYVDADPARVPQMFCAYKEVLDLYRGGLKVPDDVTIVWPDDNFGYIRNFATPAERKRSGGFGVYYHLSYLGRPLAYLWLCTTPPALVWEEMHKAYVRGADRIWIANVGDLKPAEVPLEFFLSMAWDVERWGPDAQPRFLEDWAERNFGAPFAREIAGILADYYHLNFQRKPEHLQWWLPRQPRRPSALTDAEVDERLSAFADLKDRTGRLAERLPPAARDAYFELVEYPVLGAALANERFFEGERGNVDAALAADAGLRAATHRYNDAVAGGKWRGIMALEPADHEWSSMRIAAWSPPPAPRSPVPSPVPGTYLAVDPATFGASVMRSGAAWTVVPGLGRSGHAVTVLPDDAAEAPLAQAASVSPRLDYTLVFPKSGDFELQLQLLPTHPLAGPALELGISLDDQPVRKVALNDDDGGAAWAQGVLDAVRVATATLRVPKAGRHVLHLYGLGPGVAVDKLVVNLGGLTPSYLGPTDR